MRFKSSGNLRGFKRDLYEGGVRVPFIAWWPGHIKNKSVSDHVSTFWDFMPTACALAGVERPFTTDGISYLPTLLATDNQKKHDYVYFEFHEEDGAQAVRKGKWKAVVNGVKERKTHLHWNCTILKVIQAKKTMLPINSRKYRRSSSPLLKRRIVPVGGFCASSRSQLIAFVKLRVFVSRMRASK